MSLLLDELRGLARQTIASAQYELECMLRRIRKKIAVQIMQGILLLLAATLFLIGLALLLGRYIGYEFSLIFLSILLAAFALLIRPQSR